MVVNHLRRVKSREKFNLGTATKVFMGYRIVQSAHCSWKTPVLSGLFMWNLTCINGFCQEKTNKDSVGSTFPIFFALFKLACALPISSWVRSVLMLSDRSRGYCRSDQHLVSEAPRWRTPGRVGSSKAHKQRTLPNYFNRAEQQRALQVIKKQDN